jgi:hypothetical protein
MNSAIHSLHINHLDFYLKKNILPSNFEKILWSNKFLKVSPCRNYFLWKSRWHLLLMRPWALILTLQPSHSYTLANCRPIHLISIEFQNIENNHGSLPKKRFLLVQLLWILQSMWLLWLRFFLQTISIVRYKILRLDVEKHHFILIIGPHVNKYMFEAQNSPKRPWNFRG